MNDLFMFLNQTTICHFAGVITKIERDRVDALKKLQNGGKSVNPSFVLFFFVLLLKFINFYTSSNVLY